MAWIDDRIWCHPKLLRVSPAARWAYVAGIAYSSGWGTRGLLEQGALDAIGCDKKTRRELVAAGLWEEHDGGVVVHDWPDYNDQRDDKREKDRERKRRQRSRGSHAHVTPMSRVTSRGKSSAEEVKSDKEKPLGRTSHRTARENGERPQADIDFNNTLRSIE